MKWSAFPPHMFIGLLLALAGCLAVIGTALLAHRFGRAFQERAVLAEAEAMRALLMHSRRTYPPGYRRLPPPPSPVSARPPPAQHPSASTAPRANHP